LQDALPIEHVSVKVEPGVVCKERKKSELRAAIAFPERLR
jgi:hypothetical protein